MGLRSNVMELFLALFVLVGISTGFWFYLCAKMQKLLGANHPGVYEELGRPTLFLNNNIRNGALFARFLFTKRWNNLNDPIIERHGKHMMRYFAFHTLLFVLLIAGGAAGLYNP